MFIAEGDIADARPHQATAATGRRRCVAMTSTARDHGRDTILSGSSGSGEGHTKLAILTTRQAPLPVARPARAPGAQRRSGCRVDLRDAVGQHHSIAGPCQVWIWKTDPITRSSGGQANCAPPAVSAAAANPISGSAPTCPDRGWPGRHRIPIDEVGAYQWTVAADQPDVSFANTVTKMTTANDLWPGTHDRGLHYREGSRLGRHWCRIGSRSRCCPPKTGVGGGAKFQRSGPSAACSVRRTHGGFGWPDCLSTSRTEVKLW